MARPGPIYTYVYIYIWQDLVLYTRTYIYIWQDLVLYTRMYICICMYTFISFITTGNASHSLANWYGNTWSYIHVYVYIYGKTWSYIHVYIYIYMYVYIHILHRDRKCIPLAGKPTWQHLVLYTCLSARPYESCENIQGLIPPICPLFKLEVWGGFG